MDYREYREKLHSAIEGRAKCPAAYLHTQPVKIVLDGQVKWKGKVEVFQLKEHPQAKHAFGWGFMNDQKKMEYVTVVGIPPLDNPVQAVKAFVASRR
jgi:hypothetical protein